MLSKRYVQVTRKSENVLKYYLTIQMKIPKQGLQQRVSTQNEYSWDCHIHCVLTWYTLTVNRTSKFLQNSQIELNTAVFSLFSVYSGYEEEAKQVSGLKEFSAPRQRKQSVKLAPLDYGHTEEVTFTQSGGFIIKQIIPALDQFIHSLDERLKAYPYISNLLGFHHFDKICQNEEKIKRFEIYI